MTYHFEDLDKILSEENYFKIYMLISSKQFDSFNQIQRDEIDLFNYVVFDEYTFFNDFYLNFKTKCSEIIFAWVKILLDRIKVHFKL
jgi:hypothetical protein